MEFNRHILDYLTDSKEELNNWPLGGIGTG